MFPLALWKVRLGLVGGFCAFGGSMDAVIPSRSRVTIEPVDVDLLELGDIVGVKVGDETMLHLVKAIDHSRHRVEISGTSGPSNGWASFDNVYAICTQVQGKSGPGAREKRR